MLTCNKSPFSFILALIALPISLLISQQGLTASSIIEEKYAPAAVGMQVLQVSEHVYYVEGIPGIATDNKGFISN